MDKDAVVLYTPAAVLGKAATGLRHLFLATLSHCVAAVVRILTARIRMVHPTRLFYGSTLLTLVGHVA